MKFIIKWSCLILLTITLSGCIVFGSSWIHSPSSAAGSPQKFRHVHGGAVKNAPPDALTFSFKEDTTMITVKARPISEKRHFGGIILPIIPLFWLPKTDYYAEAPNGLIINIEVHSRKHVQWLLDSAAIIFSGKTYPTNASVVQNPPIYFTPPNSNSLAKELYFPVAAKQVDAFEMINLKFELDDKEVALPRIAFKKVKQRWWFVGP